MMESAAPELEGIPSGEMRKADQVYQNINLLTIKRSVRMILDLNPEDLEEFVRKYSILVIYFLNIVDRHTAVQILDRLSANSIHYLMEEEIRTLLIRCIAGVTEEPGLIMDLSSYLDAVDRRPGEEAENDPALGRVLEIMQRERSSGMDSHSRHFEYLDGLTAGRKEVILKRIASRNLHTALAVMVYASVSVRTYLLDILAFHRSRVLQHIPPEIFLARFSRSYRLYESARIRAHLPARISKLLERRENLDSRSKWILEELMEKKESGTISRWSHRKETLDRVAHLVEKMDPDLRNLILFELERSGVVEMADVRMIQSLNRFLEQEKVGSGYWN